MEVELELQVVLLLQQQLEVVEMDQRTQLQDLQLQEQVVAQVEWLTLLTELLVQQDQAVVVQEEEVVLLLVLVHLILVVEAEQEIQVALVVKESL